MKQTAKDDPERVTSSQHHKVPNKQDTHRSPTTSIAFQNSFPKDSHRPVSPPDECKDPKDQKLTSVFHPLMTKRFKRSFTRTVTLPVERWWLELSPHFFSLDSYRAASMTSIEKQIQMKIHYKQFKFKKKISLELLHPRKPIRELFPSASRRWHPKQTDCMVFIAVPGHVYTSKNLSYRPFFWLSKKQWAWCKL